MAVLPQEAATTLQTVWPLSVVLCCLATALAIAERPTGTVIVYSPQWASGTGSTASLPYLPSLTHSHTPHTRPGPAASLKPRYGGLHAAGCHT